MSKLSNSPVLTYDAIQSVAEKFARRYRLKHDIPELPTSEELKVYRRCLDGRFERMATLIKKRILQVESEGGHGYEHLDWVSCMAGYITDKECDYKGISGEKKETLVEKTMLAGLLHDVERHLGFGETHMVEGEKTARKFMEMTKLLDENVLLAIKNHDHIDFDTQYNEDLEIIYGSLFDADHFRYGLEREDTFWRMKEKKGKPAEEVIHDYEFLPQFRDAWKTQYGRLVGAKLIDFGLAIARHVEKVFCEAK